MEIGVWGDSITYGSGDSEALGWVGRLRKELFDVDRTHVYNRGVGGDTTEDLRKRFAVEAASLEPDTIIFAIGINDSKCPAGSEDNLVPLEQFKKNIQALIEEARTYTDRILVVGMTSVNERAIKSKYKFVNDEIESYDNFLREYSEQDGITFVSMLDVLDMETDLCDGLHPNAQGYEKMFKVVTTYVI